MRREVVVNGSSGARCRALTRAGRPCAVPWQLVKRGFCPIHANRLDAAAIGRAGGVASGAVRREQGRRVRERLEEARIAAGVAQVQEDKRRVAREYRELQARKRREWVDWRYRTQQALRAELDRSLHAERVELRRLRRQRKQLESVA